MAAKAKSSTSNKITFSKKKSGSAKKKFGPKEKRPKKYAGQGR